MDNHRDNIPLGPPPPPAESDVRLKHDVTLLGPLNDGLGFYRFSYNGDNTAYVGVMAQEVQAVMPEAVMRGSDGYLGVFYDKLGLKFQTYDEWVASGGQIPVITPPAPMGPPPPPPPVSDIRLKHDITLLGRLSAETDKGPD